MESFSLRYLDISTALAPQQESIPVFFLQIAFNKVDSTDSQMTCSSSNPLRIVRRILVKQRKRPSAMQDAWGNFRPLFRLVARPVKYVPKSAPKRRNGGLIEGEDKGNVMMATSVMQVRRVRGCNRLSKIVFQRHYIRGQQVDIMEVFRLIRELWIYDMRNLSRSPTSRGGYGGGCVGSPKECGSRSLALSHISRL